MATVRDNVAKMIQSLPEDVSLEDIMAELYFRYHVDEGVKELDAGKGIPHEEVEKCITRGFLRRRSSTS